MKNSSGVTLFQKLHTHQSTLKDLIHLAKWMEQNKRVSFSFVETHGALISDLSLIENLRLEVAALQWSHYKDAQVMPLKNLLGLIINPDKLARDAHAHERFILSLAKAMTGQSSYLLVDCDLAGLSPFIVRGLKDCLMEAGKTKSLVIATDHTSMWLDCAHRIVTRDESGSFDIKELNSELVKKHWSA